MALPTEESAAIALRTQQVIAWESGVVNTVDPFGGSYADRSADRSDRARREGAARPDRRRWAGRCRRSSPGFIQREIQDAAYQAQQRIDSGESVVVGVNRYRRPSEPCRRSRRSRSIRRWRRARSSASARCAASRDPAAWRAALDAVSAAARGTDNLVPPIIRAVEAHATVGEISDAMRAVFGEHREIDV